MKRKHWELFCIMVVLVAVVCVVTYANKEKKCPLPDAVKAAISSLYPQAKIEEVKVEKEELKLYEVELDQNGVELKVTLSPDGMLVEVETEVATKDLPDVVAAAITKAAGGAEVKKVEKEIAHAVVKLVKLDKPETTYEAKVVKDGKKSEIKLAADGTVLKQSKCEKHKDHGEGADLKKSESEKHKHGHDDDDDDDDDDDNG